jgi:hypothetical protein
MSRQCSNRKKNNSRRRTTTAKHEWGLGRKEEDHVGLKGTNR